jgi:hypothetical protein
MHEAFDMDLSFEEIAMIFALKGWLHGTKRKAGIPNGEQLKAHVSDMIESLSQIRDSRNMYNSSGRFTVHTDPEMPDAYEIHLYIGNVDRQKLGVPA